MHNKEWASKFENIYNNYQAHNVKSVTIVNFTRKPS